MKERILKILVVIGMILAILNVLGVVVLRYFITNEKTWEMIQCILVLSFLGVGILVMILWPILGGIKQKPVDADNMPLMFDSFCDFSNFIHNELSWKKYHLQKIVPVSCEGKVIVYLKPSTIFTLEVFAIIHVSELSDELIENANESITNILNEYYKGKVITDNINVISVFCVDRITLAFQKLVNSNVQQGLKNGRLPVGISWDERNIYIAKQKDGFAIGKYKRLRKEFMNIMHLSNIKN